jgi:hypothetical protein
VKEPVEEVQKGKEEEYRAWSLVSERISFLTLGSLIKNCNHKGLGIYYLSSAFIFGISGT